MNYKNAFDCKNCPMTSGENGCPNWWEMIMVNHVGEQKIEKNCGYQLLPSMMGLMCRQSEHATYAAYDMRNKVIENINKVIGAVHSKLNLPKELLPEEGKTELLEDKKDETT